MPKHDIVVIGASAGGVDAVKKILSALPKDLPASLFVTVHTHPTGPGYLASVLASVSPLPVLFPGENERIEPGHVYVAPPNLHLLIKRGYVRNRFLPKENGTRPAIDPMFRSAAHAYSRRVIGVVLTGNLDDGAAGLRIIKDEGGITVVQDPQDAAHPDMPIAAVNSVRPDYVVPLSEIAPLITALVHTEVSEEPETEEREQREAAEVITCPGCGGVLRHYTDGRLEWFQCMVGHRFTSENMMLQQNTSVEEHFWRLLSLLREKEEVARTMAADARTTLGPTVDPDYYGKQAQAAEEAHERLQELLALLGPNLFQGIPHKEDSRAQESGERE